MRRDLNPANPTSCTSVLGPHGSCRDTAAHFAVGSQQASCFWRASWRRDPRATELRGRWRAEPQHMKHLDDSAVPVNPLQDGSLSQSRGLTITISNIEISRPWITCTWRKWLAQSKNLGPFMHSNHPSSSQGKSVACVAVVSAGGQKLPPRSKFF